MRSIFLLLVLACWLSKTSTIIAKPYMLIDADTGQILAHQQAFNRWYPASLTKLMTCYLVFQAIEKGTLSLDSPVLLSAQAVGQAPSKSGYKAGTVLSLRDALALTLVKSANDTAYALAQSVDPNMTHFVAQMNQQAQKLGLNGTHFANSNGLPNEKNYSNARDLAILAFALRRDFPQYMAYFSIPAITYQDRAKIDKNSNYLIGRFAGSNGMKTGFICASGYNLIASATRNGRTLIAVVLGASRVDIRETVAAQLLEFGFASHPKFRFTLADLQPYGSKRSSATNLYKQICTPQAARDRALHMDKQRNIIFTTPLIGPPLAQPPLYHIEPLRLGLAPGEVAPSHAPIPVLLRP